MLHRTVAHKAVPTSYAEHRYRSDLLHMNAQVLRATCFTQVHAWDLQMSDLVRTDTSFDQIEMIRD